MARLGDVATYVNGFAFKPTDWSDEGLPIIRIQDLTGNSYQANRYNGTYHPKYEVNDGDVLISWSASLGVYVWTGEKAVLNQHIFKVVFDKAEVDKSFFVHQVQNVLENAASEAHGATMKHLTKPVFDALPFYLPDLAKQKEIAAILDKVSELIAVRKEQLAKLDQLVKSRFIELFGSPIANEYGWPVATLGELCLKITDGEHQNPQFVDSGIPMVMANNVQDKGVVFDGCRYISAENYKKFSRKCCPEFGDVLLVSRGATIGRCCINSESIPFSLMGSVILIKNNKESISSAYLVNWLKNEEIRPLIYTTSSASAQQAVYMKDLAVRKVAVPPMGLQEQFASCVEQTDKSKLAIQQSIDKLELLKKSLMQEYFG